MEHSGFMVEWGWFLQRLVNVFRCVKIISQRVLFVFMYARSVLYDLIKPIVPMLVRVRVNDTR